jgi:hypothetical protein
MSFNFGRIANIISTFMDSDFIDLKRDVDGFLTQIYTNIPCHIEYNNTDNPDPNTVDIKPIIQSIKIYFPLWVDIQNNDYIIAKKCDDKKNILAVYSGRCGNPIVYQSRKEVLMEMGSTESDVPVPTPAEDRIKIIIKYVCDNEDIHSSIEELVNKNSSYTIFAPQFEGYNAIGYYLDDIYYENDTVNIVDVGEIDHNIKFVYEVSILPKSFRHLVNGLYTKDDGSLDIGYHLYKKIPIDSIVNNGDNTYTIVCDDVNMTHHDNFKILDISVGTKIVAGSLYLIIDSVEKTGSKVEFVASVFNPTDSERNAYECDWYG